MQVSAGNRRSIQIAILIMTNQPVFIVLDPILNSALTHELFFVKLLQSASSHIISQLIKIVGASEYIGIHLTYITHDMGCGIVRVNPNRTLLQVESGKTPDIFFQFGIEVRFQQVLENRGAERAVFSLGVQNPGPEFS